MRKIKRAIAKVAIKAIPPKTIPIEKVLLGGEMGLSAAQYSRHTKNKIRPSTRVADGPHAAFLKEYQEHGEALLEIDRFRQTDYYRNGMECINTIGSYFDKNSESGVLEVAKGFVRAFNGHEFGRHGQYSGSGSRPIVRAIKHSDCYELIDGNHKIAIAHAKGVEEISCDVRFRSAYTPLQQLLLDVGWNPNRREVYQPIDMPEIGNQWRRLRCCTDRLGMMKQCLSDHHIPTHGRYLDVACNYGWFLSQMSKLGFDSFGVELDYACKEIGKIVYGLHDESVMRGQVLPVLRSNTDGYEIVSCFSLLHHFVLGRIDGTPEHLLHELDRLTGKVLFIDTGQDHEQWFRTSLKGWNPEFISNWICENSSFQSVVALGTDDDDRPPFQGNYSRTLFACFK